MRRKYGSWGAISAAAGLVAFGYPASILPQGKKGSATDDSGTRSAQRLRALEAEYEKKLRNARKSAVTRYITALKGLKKRFETAKMRTEAVIVGEEIARVQKSQELLPYPAEKASRQ